MHWSISITKIAKRWAAPCNHPEHTYTIAIIHCVDCRKGDFFRIFTKFVGLVPQHANICYINIIVTMHKSVIEVDIILSLFKSSHIPQCYVHWLFSITEIVQRWAAPFQQREKYTCMNTDTLIHTYTHKLIASNVHSPFKWC